MEILKKYFRRTNMVSIISEQTDYNIRKLKYLSPDGKEQCQNGVYIAKGQWHRGVRINEGKFITKNKGEHFGNNVFKQQYNSDQYSGGIIIFSIDLNSGNDKSGFIDKIESFFRNKVSFFIKSIKENKKLLKLICKHSVKEKRCEEYISEDRKRFQKIARAYSRLSDFYYLNWLCIYVLAILMFFTRIFYIMILFNICSVIILHFIIQKQFDKVSENMYDYNEETRLKKINNYCQHKYGSGING